MFYYKPFTVPSEGFDRFSSLLLKREQYRIKKLTVFRFVFKKVLTMRYKKLKTVSLRKQSRTFLKHTVFRYNEASVNRIVPKS
jgi:hypothetical protein